MKLDDILNEWKNDSVIDDTSISLEAIKIPVLHEKYLRILSLERKVLRALEIEKNKLLIQKTEFYSQGPVGDEPAHWTMPRSGRVLKKDLDIYLDADDDISSITTKYIFQYQKTQELERILKSISERNYLLKNIIEWKKLLAGN